MTTDILALNRKEIEEGVFLEGRDVVFYDACGKELLRSDSFASVTRKSGSRFSKAVNGPLVHRASDGRIVHYYYNKGNNDWTEELQGDSKLRTPEKISVGNVKPPPGCEYLETRIPLARKAYTTILEEDRHHLTCCTLRNDGSLELHTGYFNSVCLSFEQSLDIQDNSSPYDIYKSLKDNESWVVIHDKKNECRYIYVCRKENNSGEMFQWSQAFVKLSILLPAECKKRQSSLMKCFWGLVWILVGVAAVYGILWYIGNKPLGLLWVPTAFFSLIALVGLVDFSFPFEYATKERTAFAFTIGPFRFYGDGRIETSLGHMLEISDKVDFSLDGYQITGRSRNSVFISNGNIRCIVFGRLREGKVRIAPVEFEASRKELETPYNPRSGFCVFDASRGLFAKKETNCGVIHQGWNGPARKTSLAVGGVEFHANGNISFGDMVIGPQRAFSQIRLGEVLICCSPFGTSGNEHCIRIIHVNDNMAWFFSYEISDSHNDWNQLVLCCS